jgi:hypothetical protein
VSKCTISSLRLRTCEHVSISIRFNHPDWWQVSTFLGKYTVSTFSFKTWTFSWVRAHRTPIWVIQSCTYSPERADRSPSARLNRVLPHENVLTNHVHDDITLNDVRWIRARLYNLVTITHSITHNICSLGAKKLSLIRYVHYICSLVLK